MRQRYDPMAPFRSYRLPSITWAMLCVIVIGSACTGGSTNPTSKAVPPSSAPTVAGAAAASISPESGGSVGIPNRVVVQLAPGAIPSAATLTVKLAPGERTIKPLIGGQALGPAYEVDLGGVALAAPATIELVFDPAALPPGTPKSAVFLAYYDEQKQEWAPVAGVVDETRNIVTAQTTHFSRWSLFSWNWDAWVVALKGVLSGSITDLVKGVLTLTTGCSESGQTLTVTNDTRNRIIKGCITNDDVKQPKVQVTNLRSFLIAVGRDPSHIALLGPGETTSTTIDLTQPPPAAVNAYFTGDAMGWFILALVARMLPAGDLLKSDYFVAAAKVLDKIWQNYGISEAWASGQSLTAATKVVELITSDKFIEALVTHGVAYGKAHGIVGLSGWTQEGAKRAVTALAAVDVIFSSLDFMQGYFKSVETGEPRVLLQWKQPVTATPTPAPALKATITTDKQQYGPRDTVRYCFTVPGPGHVLVVGTVDSTANVSILDSDDDGTGDCKSYKLEPPYGNECLALEFNGLSGTASARTCYKSGIGADTGGRTPTPSPSTRVPATQAPGATTPEQSVASAIGADRVTTLIRVPGGTEGRQRVIGLAVGGATCDSGCIFAVDMDPGGTPRVLSVRSRLLGPLNSLRDVPLGFQAGEILVTGTTGQATVSQLVLVFSLQDGRLRCERAEVRPPGQPSFTDRSACDVINRS